MRLRYPAKLETDGSGEILVSFRDFPECLTSGADQAEALVEARDALEEAVAGRIDDDGPIPTPSRRRDGEHWVTVPPDMAAKLPSLSHWGGVFPDLFWGRHGR